MSALIDAFIPGAHAAESSGGDGMTPNPYSSALGPLQFTDGTYRDAVNKYGKQYGFDMSGRTTMEGQTKATQALADNEYLPFLAKHGIHDPAPHDIYQMHLFGQPNMEKLLSAQPETSLKDALGPSYDGVMRGNGRLWGNNPNATVQDAMMGVSNYYDTGAAAPLTVGQVPRRATVASVGETNDPQQGVQSRPVDPNIIAQMSGSAGPAGPQTAQAVAQQQPGNYGQNTSQSLLRMAQGAAGKMNWGSALGGAAGGLADAQDQTVQQGMAMQGMQQKQQAMAIQQQDADTKRMEARGMVADKAAGLINAGIPAAEALQIAMAPFMGQGQGQGGMGAMPDLSNVQSTGGKATAGEMLVAPDGTHYQERNHPFGPPSFINLSSGQTVSTIPPGTMRPMDAYYKTMSGDDAKAESKGANDAIGAQRDMGVIQGFKDLIPSINAGGDIVSTIKRNFANVMGMPEASAQGAATQLMADMQTARVKMFQGLGPIRKGELDMLKASGANWQQQPAVLNMIADYMTREKQDQIDKHQAWMAKPPSERTGGYRQFEFDYQNAHKPAAPDVSPMLNKGDRPALSTFNK